MIKNKLNILEESYEQPFDRTLSYSKISDFDRNGPISFIRQSNIENEGIKHGKLVDILLTDTLLNQQEFDKNFRTVDVTKPTATLGKLTDIVLENYVDIPSLEEVKKIVETNQFWSNTKKEELKEANYNNDLFWNYLKEKFTKDERIAVTKEDKIFALEKVKILLEHPFSKNLFYNDSENIYQYFFEIKYDKFILKGVLDQIEINHNKKTVRFRDLKTGENKSSSFITSFLKYKYYLQACIYNLIFKDFCKKHHLKNYTLLNFQFIYLSKNENFPLIFEFNEKWNKAALNGFVLFTGEKVKGLHELLEEIYYHFKTNQFEFSKEIIENNGVVQLNNDFIYLKDGV